MRLLAFPQLTPASKLVAYMKFRQINWQGTILDFMFEIIPTRQLFYENGIPYDPDDDENTSTGIKLELGSVGY